MSDYETKPYEDVNNPQYKFYKLYVDGVCQFDQFLYDISKNVADSKLYSYIIAYMDNLTDGNRFPSQNSIISKTPGETICLNLRKTD